MASMANDGVSPDSTGFATVRSPQYMSTLPPLDVKNPASVMLADDDQLPVAVAMV